MTEIYQGYNDFQYGIDAFGKAAIEYYPLEKVAKLAYRAIDLTNIVITKLSPAFMLLSSQIKDLVLAIESTRFFCVAFPVIFGDKSGKSLFEGKSIIQCCEKISITIHLALKTIFGADRVGLIRLGVIGTYAIGHMPLFKWALEGTVMTYNFFGACDGAVGVSEAKERIELAQKKIEKWSARQTSLASTFENATLDREDDGLRIKNAKLKQRKWEKIKIRLQFDKTNALHKIAGTVSKFVLIVFAATIGAINFWNVPCHIFILCLGILSDGIGLKGYYYQEYCFPR